MKSKKLIRSIALYLVLSLVFTLPAFASVATPGETNSGTIAISAPNIAITKATKVILNKTKTSIFVGNNETLTATVAPIYETDQSVTWKSSKVTVATVNSNGTVTALKAGSATITATSLDGKKTRKNEQTHEIYVERSIALTAPSITQTTFLAFSHTLGDFLAESANLGRKFYFLI